MNEENKQKTTNIDVRNRVRQYLDDEHVKHIDLMTDLYWGNENEGGLQDQMLMYAITAGADDTQEEFIKAVKNDGYYEHDNLTEEWVEDMYGDGGLDKYLYLFKDEPNNYTLIDRFMHDKNYTDIVDTAKVLAEYEATLRDKKHIYRTMDKEYLPFSNTTSVQYTPTYLPPNSFTTDVGLNAKIGLHDTGLIIVSDDKGTPFSSYLYPDIADYDDEEVIMGGYKPYVILDTTKFNDNEIENLAPLIASTLDDYSANEISQDINKFMNTKRKDIKLSKEEIYEAIFNRIKSKYPESTARSYAKVLRMDEKDKIDAIPLIQKQMELDKINNPHLIKAAELIDRPELYPDIPVAAGKHILKHKYSKPLRLKAR